MMAFQVARNASKALWTYRLLSFVQSDRKMAVKTEIETIQNGCCKKRVVCTQAAALCRPLRGCLR